MSCPVVLLLAHPPLSRLLGGLCVRATVCVATAPFGPWDPHPQVFVKGGVPYMQLGSSTVPYHRAFRLYLTTSLDNPHYLPEVSTKVTLLNFIVTPSGLTDQLLGLVVKTERPDLEEEKTRLLVSRATNQRQLREIESNILSIIAARVRALYLCCRCAVGKKFGLWKQGRRPLASSVGLRVALGDDVTSCGHHALCCRRHKGISWMTPRR
jgi:hypothetical protein